MQMNICRSLRLAGVLALTGPTWALAAVSTPLELTGEVGNLVTSSFESGGRQFDLGRLALVDSSGFDLPMTLNQGDSFQANVTLDGPLTVPASPNQLLILNFGFGNSLPSYDPLAGVVVSSSMSVYLAGGLVFSTGSGCSNCVDATAGFFPGSAYSFDRMEVEITVNNLTDPYTIGPGNVALSYQLSEALPVPEPAALALWLGGLTAVAAVVRRRKPRS